MDETRHERGYRGHARRDLAKGQHVGRYRLERELGAGGMGVVWLASDPVLKRDVALKFLRAERASSTHAEERFLREARAMARLSHPGVVAVFDIGADDERVFFAMEYVEGTTLARWLLAETYAWRDVVALFVAAGRGLAAAHSGGLVHRDFKPSNVLITHDRRVKVADFGIAHAIADPYTAAVSTNAPANVRLTDPGVAPGTPGYMAPEVVAGELAGPAADQYAFAISLQEALGHLIACGVADVPRELEPIIARGLAASESERYPAMTAMLDELEHVLATGAARELTFGFPPSDPLSEKRHHVAELARCLSLAGLKLRAAYGADYRGLVEDLVAGRADAAWLAPLSLVRADRGARAVLALRRADKCSYHGALVVRRDAGIARVEDLAGRRAGWVDEDSAAGYVFPRGLIAETHTDVDRFLGAQRMLGSHREVVEAVLEGWVDVGATFLNRSRTGEIVLSGWMEFLGNRSSELAPIAVTDPIAGDVIAVRAGLFDRDATRLVDALRALLVTSEGRALFAKVFNGAEGVEPPNAADYVALAVRAKRAGWRL